MTEFALGADSGRASAHTVVTESLLATRRSSIPLESRGACALGATVVRGTAQSVPIRRPTTWRPKRGDTVMIDVGAEVHGCQSDAARTFVLGPPSGEQRRAWSVVLLDAYEAAVGLARPRVPCPDVDQAASNIIGAAGYQVAHRIGRGIGLAASYQWPTLDTEAVPPEPGMTIAVEPGVYFSSAGNVKLEEDAFATDSGYDVMTGSECELELTL